MQWGWLAAGVPTMLIARWSAPPESRDRLLGEFHKRLRAGEPVGDAWAAAQHLIRSTPETAAPVHWAGWMLLGARATLTAWLRLQPKAASDSRSLR